MSFIEAAACYADSVITGELPECLHVINACKRFVNDLQRDDIYLSDDAERWCQFLEKLPHVKGRWANRGELFKLAPYQIFCTANLYGWKWTHNDLRRFREGYIELPRKNGKSFWVAGIGLGHLCIDGETGAEVYCGATNKRQAWMVFEPARDICLATPDLRDYFGIEINAESLYIIENRSWFRPVVRHPGDGGSPSTAIIDEFHEHKDQVMYDAFRTGMGAREQPMMLIITTAGSDVGGPCYEKRCDVIEILKGTVVDDTIFGIIYTIDEDDEWDTVEAQQKANPNYGVSVDPQFLAGELAIAKRSASHQSTYKTKHLNLWVGAKAAWMNMLAFELCRKKAQSIDDYEGRECHIAIDLASKIDFTTMTFLFPEDDGSFAVFCKHYLPEDRLNEDGPGMDRYRGWHADGWITTTEGNIIDFDVIENDLKDAHRSFNVIDVPYDPHHGTQFATRMLNEGIDMVEYRMIVSNFSEPMKQLEAWVLNRRMVFDRDPVLHWMFGNVVARMDAKDCIFPRKERYENKIDGVVALIMTIGRVILTDDYISFPADYKLPMT